MVMRPKNWSTFQHYKDRRPPWIRLYHHLIDQAAWWALKGDDAKCLMIIWLIASEHEHGDLPELADLAFRLRMPVPKCQQLLQRLSAWLERTADNVLAKPEQVATPEGEKRREETEGEADARERSTPSALPPMADPDPAEIPEGLTGMQYAGIALYLGGIEATPERGSPTLKRTVDDKLVLLARDEACSLPEAVRRMGQRMKRAGPQKWHLWLQDGGWKQQAMQGVNTEGWE